jgi:hypothetical protein
MPSQLETDDFATRGNQRNPHFHPINQQRTDIFADALSDLLWSSQVNSR